MILRNEKIFKTNTRKARNPRNTHGRLLYPLVFFRLKKGNGKIEKIIETHERHETHTLVRHGPFFPPFDLSLSKGRRKQDTPDKSISLNFYNSLEYKKYSVPKVAGRSIRRKCKRGGRLFVEKSDRLLIKLRFFGSYTIS
jgi:hypothetical protein